MNSVNLVGRLTASPEVRTASSGNSIARFTVAVDRGKNKEGVKETDFPSCVAYGKTAETVDKYCFKGMMVGITGNLHTGKYEKDGRTVYFTEVVVNKLDFMSKREDAPAKDDRPVEGFQQILEDVPF
ncbi:MAG: single-stranded DNA-binding protein [Oscillospiraceae bacterium]|nr:single-stranded DNA-binding protein [Oscillospiraceae bacterium]